jgi:hypothetical protein
VVDGEEVCMYMSKHIYTAQELCWTLLKSSWNINGWPTRNMPTRDGLGMYRIRHATRIDIYKSTSTPTQTSGCVYVYTHSQLVLGILDLFVSNLKKTHDEWNKVHVFLYIILNSPSPAVSNCY